MASRLALLAACLLMAGTLPASAQGVEPALQRCRSLTVPAERLACYDAIPTRSTPPAPGSAAPPATPAGVPQAAAPVPVATQVPPVSVLPGSPLPTERFGLPDKAPGAELQAIESRVGDDFFGWGPNERIRLDNGQVWQVIDGSSGNIRPANRKVRVRRGSMGTFFLEFEGQNNTPRVRRVQ